jgi:predicted kinase
MEMELIAWILVGAPGSGKSTWGKILANGDPSFIRLCPDDFRAEFGRGEDDQSVSVIAFDTTRRRMDFALKDGFSVIIDATNMYRKARKQFIDIANMHGAKTIAVVFEVDKNTLLDRNQKRGAQGGRNVPEFVIDKMLAKYERPTELEFDKVEFVCKLTS